MGNDDPDYVSALLNGADEYGDQSDTEDALETEPQPPAGTIARYLETHRALRASALEGGLGLDVVLGPYERPEDALHPLLNAILKRTTSDVHDTALSTREAYQELHALLANNSKPLVYGPEGGGKLTCGFSVCKRVGMFPWVLHTVDLLDPVGRQALAWVVNNDKRAVIVLRDAHNLTDESLAVLALGLSGRNPPCVGLASSPSQRGCRARGFFGSAHHWPAVERHECEDVAKSVAAGHALSAQRLKEYASLDELCVIAMRGLTISAVCAALNVAMQTTSEQLATAQCIAGSTAGLYYMLRDPRTADAPTVSDPLAVVAKAHPRTHVAAMVMVAWFTRLLVSPVDATDFGCYR